MEACANTYLINQHLAEREAAALRDERIDQLAQVRATQLTNSYGDWIEALREATWTDKLQAAHIAHLKGDTAEMGTFIAEMITGELQGPAKEWAEDEYQSEIENGYGEA